MTSDRFEKACAVIDDANRADPRGREIEYSRRMTEWTNRLAPEASEELLLAVRAQHICRWEISRGNYPEGRKGYLQWRETLKKHHGDKLAGIMAEAGYDEDEVLKSRKLILQKNLAADEEGQVLEDAACLVFLEMDFTDFASRTDDAKMVDILRKSWEKMSLTGREEALKLTLGEKEKSLLSRALGK